MKRILDFKTSTSIEQHILELKEWIEDARMVYPMSYNQISIYSKEIFGSALNIHQCLKGKSITTTTLNKLSSPFLLNFEFRIERQDEIVVVSSSQHNWVRVFLEHAERERKKNGVDVSQMVKELNVSRTLMYNVATRSNIHLEVLFKYLKYFGYRMVFQTKELN